MGDQDVRWKQRFENFEKARQKFHNALAACQKDPKNELYQMALIQTFEFTYELGWKTIKDFLQYEGVKKVSFPREVIKYGFHHHIIEEGQDWINMMDDRNLMAHTYDEEKANKAIHNITQYYVKAIDQVYLYLKKKLD
ncbi:Protein of unknown function DUF86, Caur_2869 group [hydrothermal vent metagenome]|uniref:Nucleotidyltransferase n=1 Tax=hydrothermal vent metagenome TaxID=652676 RepID=A0A3B1D1S2_9ZZZZ